MVDKVQSFPQFYLLQLQRILPISSEERSCQLVSPSAYVHPSQAMFATHWSFHCCIISFYQGGISGTWWSSSQEQVTRREIRPCQYVLLLPTRSKSKEQPCLLWIPLSLHKVKHIPEYNMQTHALIHGTMIVWQLVRTGITDKDSRTGMTPSCFRLLSFYLLLQDFQLRKQNLRANHVPAVECLSVGLKHFP